MTNEAVRGSTTAPNNSAVDFLPNQVLTALLALSVPASYAFVLAYETGYADHFGYPRELIEVEFPTALLVWGTLLAFVAVVLIGVGAAILVLPARASGVVVRASWNVGASAIGAAFFWANAEWFGSGLPEMVVRTFAVVYGMLALISLLQLIVVGSSRNEGEGLIDAWERLNREQRHQVERTFEGSVIDRLRGRPAGWISAVLLGAAATMFALVIAHRIGTANAETTEDFLVHAADPGLVVLRVYGSNALVADVDREERVVQGRFAKLPIAGTDVGFWALEHIGRLTAAPLGPPKN